MFKVVSCVARGSYVFTVGFSLFVCFPYKFFFILISLTGFDLTFRLRGTIHSLSFEVHMTLFLCGCANPFHRNPIWQIQRLQYGYIFQHHLSPGWNISMKKVNNMKTKCRYEFISSTKSIISLFFMCVVFIFTCNLLVKY